jgi:hypothetical protein
MLVLPVEVQTHQTYNVDSNHNKPVGVAAVAINVSCPALSQAVKSILSYTMNLAKDVTLQVDMDLAYYRIESSI